MSLPARLGVLSALHVLNDTSPQLLQSYRPLVEATVLKSTFPDSQVHRCVADILRSIGHTTNPLDGGCRSFDDLIPEDTTTETKLCPGLKEYFMAYDTTQWLITSTGKNFVIGLAMQATSLSEAELGTTIKEFVDSHRSHLRTYTNMEDDMLLGIKLLVHEQLGGTAMLSILMAYNHYLKGLPIDQLEQLMDLFRS